MKPRMCVCRVAPAEVNEDIRRVRCGPKIFFYYCNSAVEFDGVPRGESVTDVCRAVAEHTEEGLFSPFSSSMTD